MQNQQNGRGAVPHAGTGAEGSGALPHASAGTAGPGGYTDYILRRAPPSHVSGWRHNVLKFASPTPIDLGTLRKPVRLNRKDPRYVRQTTERLMHGEVSEEPESAPEGEVRERRDAALVGKGVHNNTSSQGDVARAPGRRAFQRRTKRVFVSTEEARRLRREEWQPWVLEEGSASRDGRSEAHLGGEGRPHDQMISDDDSDSDGKTRGTGNHRDASPPPRRWIGRLEGGAGATNQQAVTLAQQRAQAADKKGIGLSGWRPTGDPASAGSAYVVLVPSQGRGGSDAEGDGFSVVPIHRWYRFSSAPQYATLNADEAEKLYEEQQKSGELGGLRWAMWGRGAADRGEPRGEEGSPKGKEGVKEETVGSTGYSGFYGNDDADAKVKTEAETKPKRGDGVLSAKQARMLKKTRVVKAESKPRMTTVISEDVADAFADPSKPQRSTQNGEFDEFDYEEDFQDDEEGVATIDDQADKDEVKELEERIKKEMRAVERSAEDDGADEAATDEELTKEGREVKKLMRKMDKSGVYEGESESEEEGSSEAGADEPSEATRREAEVDGAGAAVRSGTPGLPGSRASTPTPGTPSKRKREDSVASDILKKNRRHSPAPGSPGSANSPANSPAAGSAGLITEADIIALLRTKPSFSTKEVLTHFRRELKADARNKEAIRGLLQKCASFVNGDLVLKKGL